MSRYNNSRLWIVCALLLFFAISCGDKRDKQTSVMVTEETKTPGDSASLLNNDFAIPEPEISASPNQPQSIPFASTDEVISYDESPLAPVAAILIKNQSDYKIQCWQIGQTNFTDNYTLPSGFSGTEIKWHPKASALFVLGVKNGQHQILRVKKTKDGWETKSIFSSPHPLQNLVVCPRPFSTYDSTITDHYGFRIFFGEAYDNAFKIASVNENGGWYYQVVGPEKSLTTFEPPTPEPPSEMKANWAMPVAFHPAGHQLIWKNNSGKLFAASYAGSHWGNYAAMPASIPTGFVSPTPNGLGVLHWQQGKAGIGVYLLSTKKEEIQLTDYTFLSAPCSVADGKGVIGLTKSNGQLSLSYVPIQVPMADVVNAWMYASNSDEVELFKKNDGLFRTTKMDELYELYETENYACSNGYDNTTPTRPYLVTTDIFWELYSAAYEGLFVVKERDEAIPQFWHFIEAAKADCEKNGGKSRWTAVFAALVDLENGNKENEEVKLMQAASGSVYSAAMKRNFNYADLKPRGHYTANEDMKKYFIAFKYFTTAFRDSTPVQAELNTLPAETRKYAEQWIECYTGFISGSRTPMVWAGLKNNPPAYNQYPGTGTTIFPLSWGYDNEILYTDVFHDNVPADKQITGPGGARLLPSGLDLAAVMGNNLADQLLNDDYEKYPPLRKAIAGLRQNFQTNVSGAKADNLYDLWLNTLATQWIDTLGAPNGKHNDEIWKAKRLQTGLASWATLRHATGLVNETGAAECGEGGFEEIILRAPRGYVEPDPKTFAAIADLFDATVKFVPKSAEQTKGDEKNTGAAQNALDDGITKRLQQTAKEARLFGAMAEKEKRGEPLTSDEYEKILFLGRVAEHNFLIFKSLLNTDYGLAVPDPISKVAEVFGDGAVSPYLMAAVGNTLEWDNVVPFFGRHEIVKGAVYSYYEFKSDNLLNDKEWTDKVKSQPLQPWVNSFVTNRETSRPAATGY